jgi:NAD(P)-dependent dehydrogenase (short-subunit alcohol dehydrogenase family)
VSNVVITGSTRGIGRGLAVEFLKRGHNVVVSSRRQADVDKAVAELAAVGMAKAVGRTCDVTKKADVQALWDFAVATFGHVDFWINNAGRATSRFAVHELPEELVHTLVDGNLKGSIFGSQVAITGFRRQGSGALYNMLGGSFDGKRLTPNMGVYSATKSADWLMTKYLVRERNRRSSSAPSARHADHGELVRRAEGMTRRLAEDPPDTQHPLRLRRDLHALAGRTDARQPAERPAHRLDDDRQALAASSAPG